MMKIEKTIQNCEITRYNSAILWVMLDDALSLYFFPIFNLNILLYTLSRLVNSNHLKNQSNYRKSVFKFDFINFFHPDK